MGIEKRSEATNCTPQDDDTFEKNDERENANGNPVTAADIAKFNWDTDDPDIMDEYPRDELGYCTRGEDKRFVISSKADARSALLIPKHFKNSALSIDRSATLRVKKKAEPPPQNQ